jgi:hypothetical protein
MQNVTNPAISLEDLHLYLTFKYFSENSLTDKRVPDLSLSHTCMRTQIYITLHEFRVSQK